MSHRDWLERFRKQDFMSMPFPLDTLLTDSVYYPSSGLDGDPVQYLGKRFQSYLYVDYGVSREDLLQQLEERPFRGYEILANRSVTARELAPYGWRPSPPDREDEDPASRADVVIKTPYCQWIVFERTPDFEDDHGPSRFSLIYLSADGVAAYQALYWERELSPAVLAIIQPGAGFGGNYTRFDDRSSVLAKTVMDGPTKPPGELLFGGTGDSEDYQSPCWPEYSEFAGRIQRSGGGRISHWTFVDLGFDTS